MKLRDTFTQSADGGHLWVVCSLPTESDGSVVIINMTSWHEGCDDSCIINVGDHPWVVKKTVMKFDAAELLTPGEQAKKTGWGYASKPAVTPELLARIQKAAVLSMYTAGKIQTIVRWSRAKQARG